MTEPTIVFLARHGETVWNVERVFQGHQDSELTARGREQARRLGQRLAAERLQAVYASDLGRAMRTAEQVARHHALEVRPHQGLREIDTGVWTGLPRDEVRAAPEWSAMLDLYRRRPWEHRMPGGETVGEVQARSLAAVRQIAEQHPGERVAVIAHHLVVETIMAEALEFRLDQLWLPYRGGNCFLNVLAIEAGRLLPRTLYDGSHLDGLLSADGEKSATRERS
jgi:broad specificity phosphatase PhoE